MGLTVSSFNFLKYLTKNNLKLGKTLTLGRQNDHYGWINPSTGKIDKYCEPVFTEEFKATIVESVDANNYENATHIQDLNKPWTCQGLLKDKFSTIVDFGTLEHVFNIPQALDSIANACEIGGHIIHVQNHSDWCGHGFWMLSAELFFSWYSEENGFSDLEVFIAPNKNPNLWFRCLKPKEGYRIDLTGRKVPKSEILVKVKKVRQVSNRNCQQNNYLHRWNLNKIESPENLNIPKKTFISKIVELIPKEIKIYIKAKSEFYLKSFVWWKSEHLIKENVKDLIK